MEITKEQLLKLLEFAHMAGQLSQVVDPSYYEAKTYSISAIENFKGGGDENDKKRDREAESDRHKH